MQRRLGAWRLIRRSQACAFAGGMLVLFIAFVSPLDALAGQLFSAHMVQHLLLLFVAPPLLVWSRPALAFVWAFRARPRRSIGMAWNGLRLNHLVRFMMHPNVVWVLFSGLFIFWHFPRPFAWALQSEALHVVEHLSFFISGLMFWTIVIEPSGRRRLSYGATLVHVATTAVLASLPGALIVLAPRPLYPLNELGAAIWGLTPLQDQQLAGVIMWVPAGLAYVAAVVWLFVNWMRQAEMEEIRRLARLSAPVMLVMSAPLFLVACSEGQEASAQPLHIGGNPQHGRELIGQYGCGSCHTIPGINGADALVGPPLDKMGRRIYIVGMLRNTPENMMQWLENPQQIVPGNAMPNMQMSRDDARDLTAFLYTLR